MSFFSDAWNKIQGIVNPDDNGGGGAIPTQSFQPTDTSQTDVSIDPSPGITAPSQSVSNPLDLLKPETYYNMGGASAEGANLPSPTTFENSMNQGNLVPSQNTTATSGYGPIPEVQIGGFLPDQQYTDVLNMIMGDLTKPEGESLAQQILQNQAQKDVKSAAALLGTQRGVNNPALLARAIANISAERGAEAAGKAAESQIQEDYTKSLQRLKTQTDLAQLIEANRQARIDRERLQSNQNISQATGESNAQQAELDRQQRQDELDQQRTQQYWNTGGQIVANLLPYMLKDTPQESKYALRSDKNAKKNIKDGGEIAESFLNSLRAIEFDYKDPQFDGVGNWGGVLAQDVEKGPGKKMVGQDAGGKNIDFVKGLSMMLAGMGNLNDRVKKLEA